MPLAGLAVVGLISEGVLPVQPTPKPAMDFAFRTTYFGPIMRASYIKGSPPHCQ